MGSAGKPASEVWLLAASTGGLRAVSAFLASIRPLPDIGFLYAQHIETEQAGQLVKMIERRCRWPVKMLSDGDYVAEGEVAVVSPGEEFAIRHDGTLEFAGRSWTGPYSPCIDAVAAQLVNYYRDGASMIVFTGMGDNGVEGSQLIEASGGSVWVQSPATCIVSALPEAVLTRGAHHLLGDIATFADNFNQRRQVEEGRSLRAQGA
jgi:chemosensory pili system protein ChpB (putative protein-glutamate methylesterase)